MNTKTIKQLVTECNEVVSEVPGLDRLLAAVLKAMGVAKEPTIVEAYVTEVGEVVEVRFDDGDDEADRYALPEDVANLPVQEALSRAWNIGSTARETALKEEIQLRTAELQKLKAQIYENYDMALTHLIRSVGEFPTGLTKGPGELRKFVEDPKNIGHWGRQLDRVLKALKEIELGGPSWQLHSAKAHEKGGMMICVTQQMHDAELFTHVLLSDSILDAVDCVAVARRQERDY